METKTFSSAIDRGAGEAFESWRLQNPSGFYINQKEPASGMLHTGKCSHVERGGTSPEKWNEARHVKHCNTDRDDLLTWARQKGVRVDRCNDCRP